MSQLSFLIQDIFTFLALLSADDVRPIGARYLPPSLLRNLNPLLVVPDSLNIKHLRTAKGQWQGGVQVRNSERHTERIRFIHFLAEASQIVARTGPFLKPTPRAQPWLTGSNLQRARLLFRAAFPTQPTRADDERWRAFRLPGHHWPTPLSAVNQLLDLLRQAPPDEHIKLSTLLKLLAWPAYEDDHPDHAPEVTLRSLLQLLAWFEIITWPGVSMVQLTPIGAALLERPDAPPLAPEPNPQRLSWSKPRPDMLPTLSAPLDSDLSLLYALSEYAVHQATFPSPAGAGERESLNKAQGGLGVRVYQLDAARIRRALDQGQPLAHLYEFLEQATGDALPRAVADWLDTLGREYGQITLRTTTLLEVDDPALLTELARSRYIRECLRRTLSPRAVVVKPSRVHSLAHRLVLRGYQPRLELPNHPSAQAPKLPIAQRFDHPTLAHLYLSARLTHQLADLIPASYRPPYSIVLDLEQQLTEHDREVADELVQDCVKEMHRTADRQRATFSPPMFYGSKILETQWKGGGVGVGVGDTSVVESIQRALDTRTALEIVYHSPYNDETTTRLIEPLRLESRDGSDYVIAYCHLRRDERTFRVDRILEIRAPQAESRRATYV